jgi:hypothetical protein
MEVVNIQADEEITNLTLLNYYGAEMYSVSNFRHKTLKINVKDLAPGIYYLKIETKRKKYSKKILVIR